MRANGEPAALVGPMLHGSLPTDPAMNMPQSSWSGTAADFVRHVLRENPDLDYAAIKQQASDLGLAVPPIIYGRVRKELPAPAKPAAPPASAGNGQGSMPADAQPAGARQDAPKKASKSPALDYAMQVLRERPDASYRELKEQCDSRGWKLPPILYGRAKALLGLVPVKPRTSKKEKAAAAAAAAPPSPLRLRQVESVAAAAFSQKLDDIRNLDQLVAAVREIDAERRRLRDLLEKIVDMIDETLG